MKLIVVGKAYQVYPSVRNSTSGYITLDDVVDMASKLGLEIDKEEIHKRSGYLISYLGDMIGTYSLNSILGTEEIVAEGKDLHLLIDGSWGEPNWIPMGRVCERGITPSHLYLEGREGILMNHFHQKHEIEEKALEFYLDYLMKSLK